MVATRRLPTRLSNAGPQLNKRTVVLSNMLISKRAQAAACTEPLRWSSLRGLELDDLLYTMMPSLQLIPAYGMAVVIYRPPRSDPYAGGGTATTSPLRWSILPRDTTTRSKFMYILFFFTTACPAHPGVERIGGYEALTPRPGQPSSPR